MTTQHDVSYRDTLEILFANRNKAYGAYQLRRAYDEHLKKAFLGGLVFIGFLVALPKIIKAVNGILPEEKTEVVAIFEDHIKIDTETPPTPPPPIPETPPPPTRSTERFVPPVVDEDKKVNEEPDKLAIDEFDDKTDIGTKTQVVDKEGQPNIDEPVDIPVAIESPKEDPDRVLEFMDVNKPPTFPGGEKELLRFLAENIKYPSLARETGIQGNVALSFVIGRDGSIQDIQVLRDIGGGCGKEAVRVVNIMPKWSPGEANGHKVKVRFTLPVRFRLE